MRYTFDSQRFRDAVDEFGGQNALARESGVSQPTISAWYRGAGSPTLARWASVAICLGEPMSAYVTVDEAADDE